jgi:glycosyltransferase involved in cell wall biosynthesis
MSRSVISYYEIDAEMRRALKLDSAEGIRYAAVNKMNRNSPFALLRDVRKLRADSIAIAANDEIARPFIGPLILLAAVSGSREIEMLLPDGASEKVTRWGILRWLVKILGAQVTSRWAYQRARPRLKSVEAPAQRIGAAPQSNRVLYLDANVPLGAVVGGSVGHTRGVIDGLVREGFSVDYASGKRIPTDLAGTRWLSVPKGDFLALPPELNSYTFNQEFERRVREWAAGSSYSFIYQRMSVHNFTGALLRRTLGIPLVLEYNGSEVWAAANWGKKLRLHDMAARAEQVSLLNADLVVTVSDALVDEVVAAGVSPDKVLVYPNCIDPEIFDLGRFPREQQVQLRRRLGIDPGAMLATFIGTFGAWHGVDFLAKAIRRLVDEDHAWVLKHKLHFLLIGDGLKMAEVRHLVGDKPYADYVTLTGMIPQTGAPEYLAASDIFLSPHVPNSDGSVFFGSPTKLFEYMAMERPIVASDLAQIGKVLRGTYFGAADGTARPIAELFTPGNESEFLSALRRVVDDPDWARSMARDARAAAIASFTWQNHVRAILARANHLGILRS